LLDAGVHTLVIANRTFERAQMLAAALAQPERVGVMRWDALGTRAPFELIVNATSAGVQHVALVLPAVLVDADTVAYDLSYGPAARPFVEWAKAAGCARASDGLGMLVETAAASFERWHRIRPDVGAALGALRDLLP
jgi:shikimate dehydrogenase